MTHQIVEDAVPGKFRVRIIEEDGSCNSEPLYPNALAPTPESKEIFAEAIIARVVAQRDEDSRPPEEDVL